MKTKLTVLLILASCFLLSAYGGSATWKANPSSGDWNTASNWSPATVPNGASDTASFASSSRTAVSISSSVEVNGITYNSGANAFTTTVNQSQMLTLSGLGITNNSGITQNFVVGNNPAQINFTNSATPGAQTSFITNGGTTSNSDGGVVSFNESSSAGDASIINDGRAIATASGGGEALFLDSASAGNATITNLPNGTPIGIFGGGGAQFLENATAASAVITNEGATISGQIGGATNFDDTSDAGSATIICNGGQVASAGGGIVHFTESGNPANATLIANTGVNGGDGGQIQLFGRSAVGAPRVMIFGNGTLDITGSSGSAGSLEGDGIAKIGNGLTVGSNNLSTVFSGTIQTGGALIKVGTGTLTLTGINAYGQTEVDAGTLIVDGTTGSTGITGVQVAAGTIGGSGVIPGSLIIGNGTPQTDAFLAPAAGTRIPTTLTVQESLDFSTDAAYTYTFKAKGRRASTDLVIANGVFIGGNARITLRGKVQGALQSGLVLTLISNTSATPISGTFSNLADGAIVTIGGANFQANYEGGDGNDLTLTVL